MLRWMIAGLVVPAVFLAIAGCGQGGFSERASAGKENVFRYPIVANPTTLDPGLVQDGDTNDMLQQVFEGLVRWNVNNEIEGALAESWEIDDAGRVYTFTIREGATFSNGDPVTAEDFKWTIERNTNPSVNSSTAANYLTDIVGVEEKLRGEAEEVAGVEVVAPNKIQITIKEPAMFFLGKMSYPVSWVLNPRIVPENEGITRIDQMIGTGPFVVESYQPNQIVVLKANQEYWDGAPSIEAIERPVTPDPVTRLNKFRTGEFDLVPLERQDITAVQKDPVLASQLKFYDRPAIWYIGMNQDAYEPFKDRRVRRAFAMAIDRSYIVDTILGGINQEAKGIVPPGVPGHQESPDTIEFNPEEAQRLLAEAGYPNGQGLPPFELSFREARPDIRIVAEAVSTQLKKNLGVDARLQTMEWGAYLNRWNRGEIPFFHMRWMADYLDPQNFLSLMLMTDGPENKIGYSNAEFDRLCAEADRSMDMAFRLSNYNRAENIVLQDAPWIPIYFQRDAELVSPRVQGIRDSLLGHLPHARVRLEDVTTDNQAE
ncbi:MAG: ABC transporter substrate-binding protein [Fimbriimonadaceae bacterium]